MNNWRQRYQIVEKWKFDMTGGKSGTYYIIIDKLNPGMSVNFTKYYYKNEAASAASNIFRAEQRKIEKILFDE